ncbi:actin-related protein 10-like [Gigantopelta aegis]|uniref:actin-related protein 10-like n=1 Tax=Gigantopelta aegis TaxID=1735272 RepID=UPI001B8879B8|nr:actin-related protein 10-like [Gigantopelta aegis]
MPLFEGLSFGAEQNIVVVDIGEAYTKCGLAGETAPKCIIPSEVKDSKSGKVVKLWNYSNTDDLYEQLKDFFYRLYFRHLLITPKDKHVVVVESLLCPSDFRETLAKVLFLHYKSASVLFAPSHMVCLMSVGTNTGLVMDAGYSETVVIPVYDGIPILKAWQAVPLAGKAIHSEIESKLKEYGTVEISLADSVDEEVLENIKAQCCFVTDFKRAQHIFSVMKGNDKAKLPKPPPDVSFPLDGSNIIMVKGEIREHVCEVLFQQDNDEKSVATLLLDSLVECPIDVRRKLAENIVILGGTAMLPGFYHRLRLELYYLMSQLKYRKQLAVKVFKFHKPPAKENYTAWLGGAMFGALETLQMRSLQRETYLQSCKLPDWCNVSLPTPETTHSVKRSTI